jgi:hypothetical protein
MAFTHTNSKGKPYILHKRNVKLRGGRDQVIFFFAKEEKEGAIDAVPDGYMVIENKKTGLPMLKRDDK